MATRHPGTGPPSSASSSANPTQTDIETIRVTAHLVGAREWPAYENPRYLHYLRNVEFMDYDELIARCGGNKTTITRQIDAKLLKHYFVKDTTLVQPARNSV